MDETLFKLSNEVIRGVKNKGLEIALLMQLCEWTVDEDKENRLHSNNAVDLLVVLNLLTRLVQGRLHSSVCHCLQTLNKITLIDNRIQ